MIYLFINSFNNKKKKKKKKKKKLLIIYYNIHINYIYYKYTLIIYI